VPSRKAFQDLHLTPVVGKLLPAVETYKIGPVDDDEALRRGIITQYDWEAAASMRATMASGKFLNMTHSSKPEWILGAKAHLSWVLLLASSRVAFVVAEWLSIQMSFSLM